MSKQIERWIKVLEAKRVKVGRVRDDLASVVSEMEQLRENCETAYYDLQSAIDALSELA